MTITALDRQAGRPLVQHRFGGLALAIRFALRDLRGGIQGFAIFIACMALGVAAITGVAAISRGLSDGLAREGRTILGGDISFTVIHREVQPAESAWLRSRGDTTVAATMRAMARAPGGSALVELKAVDGAYPRHGSVVTEPAVPLADALGRQDGVFGALADPLLFARLNLKPGDEVLVGDARVRLVAALTNEPDKLAGGLGFGPRLLMSLDGLKASGLLQPGSLVRWSYRLSLPAETDDRVVEALGADARRAFPEAGWEIRTRMNASPQFGRQLERFTQFLTLVGLTALVVGGVGVANATRAFIERKRVPIATLKSIGATGGLVFRICLVQVLALAAVGIMLGVVVGTLLPFLLVWTLGSLIPFPLAPSLFPTEILLGIGYGLLTTLAFAIWPLGRAHDIPVSALFRDTFENERAWPRWGYMLAVAAATLALAGMAVFFAWDRRIAIIYVVAAAAAFLMLRLVASGIMALAARAPRPRMTEARLALVSLHRPGALTPSVVLSLGLGLTLLVSLGLIDTNLRAQLTRNLPERAPSFFFIDIPSAEVDRFEGFLKERAGDGRIERVPMMRGRIVSINNTPVEQIKAPEQVSWVLDGDRGITYAEAMPPNSRLVTGEWWPPGYRGEPLVSFTTEIANGLGLKVGDRIVVNVLGRNLTVRLANTRTVEWQTLGINFVMVFSPNTFAGAPHMHLATLTYPGKADIPRELALARDVAESFPAISSVRVKEALEAANTVVAQLAAAVRGASGIALIASVLVLAGALAAGHRNRVNEAVILKTLGATRPRLLLAYILEYGLLGLVTAVFGLAAGTGAAMVVIGTIMNLKFTMDWTLAVSLVLLALFATIALGLMGTWRILGQKPAPYLRNL
jgi:putative ABC transport system permease protein